MANQEEERIINRLKAQRPNVRPSRALLERILSQLSVPAAPQGFSLSWLRIAIPAGVAVLIGFIFLQMQGDPTQITQVQQEQSVSTASLATEEVALEQTFEQQESFFEDELLIGEVTLSDF